MDMNGRVGRTMLMLVLMAGIFGCASPKQFQYKLLEQGARKCGTQFDGVSICVLPMNDARMVKTSTEGWSMLAFLPLVPYVSFYNYDMQSYSGDTGRINFNPTLELRTAIMEHLRFDGLGDVSGVKLSNNSIRQYVLESDLRVVCVEGIRTLYCLGWIPGSALPWVGMPFTYANSRLELELRMKNSAGETILKKIYSADRDYKVGLYYNWNVFKQVGFNLAAIMNEFCEDAALAIATDYPDAKLTHREYEPSPVVKPKPKTQSRDNAGSSLKFYR